MASAAHVSAAIKAVELIVGAALTLHGVAPEQLLEAIATALRHAGWAATASQVRALVPRVTKANFTPQLDRASRKVVDDSITAASGGLITGVGGH